MDGTEHDGARRVCSVDDLREDEGVVHDVDGTAVAVFSIDGSVYALENVCPHQGGPLGEGKVEDGCVYCPWHGWQFDVESGEHVHGKGAANAFDVTVDDGDVYVSF